MICKLALIKEENFAIHILSAHAYFLYVHCIFELFCLQNSLIVGVQPQVSGKVGSLVGFWVANVRHSRRLSNFTERLVVGAGTKMQMRTHGKFCY